MSAISKNSAAWQVKFNDLAPQNREIFVSALDAIEGIVQGNALILGPRLESFEKSLASYVKMPHAVGVSSGTDALSLALQAVNVSPGDEVVTVANTAPATVSAIRAIGAIPVFSDVDQNGLMDPKLIKESISWKTRAVVPVHLYGRLCDMSSIAKVAGREGVEIIEDAAQAIGVPGVGEHSAAAAISFYPTKNLGGWGDGGAVVTKTDEIAETIKRLRNYGMESRDVQKSLGRNARLDPIQAAILEIKLKKLDQWNQRRAKISEIYVAKLPQEVQRRPIAGENFHLYTIHCDLRNELQKFLAERSIETYVHYRIPLHRQEANWDLLQNNINLLRTESHCRTALSLPLWPAMEDSDAERVADAVREFCHA